MFGRLIATWDKTTFYLSTRVYYAGFAIALVFMVSFFVPILFSVAVLAMVGLATLVLVDTLIIYSKRDGVTGTREIKDRLSNGDENKISITVNNHYRYKINCRVIDELPVQFQERDWIRQMTIDPESEAVINYTVKPLERGEYNFGAINVYVSGPLSMVKRRYIFPQGRMVKVYPSYIQMRKYQLMAVGAQLQQSGMKRIRKVGHSMEFEQIKEYVRGDDYRTINWKATAHHGDLMVNNYTDERSQQIYCVINKGRVMKMPFDGMTLLDYSINASLVLSAVALQRQDRVGLITFSDKSGAFLQADKKPAQINTILDTLYNQQTNFMEPDIERLFSVIRNRITQRSLLVLFTNYESLESLQREMPFLKRLAHYHLLMVIFFENTELKQLTDEKAVTIEDIYIKTIAEKYRYEKQLMVRELQKQGIISVLTTPQKLTINSLNKYLELKHKQSI